MMFVKPRKFRRMIEGKWTGRLVFDAMDIIKSPYFLRRIGLKEDCMWHALEIAVSKGWDPDKALVMVAKIKQDMYVGTPASRIVMVIKDMTLERLVKITNQVVSMKAFL